MQSPSGFYIRTPHGLLPPRVPDMLVNRIGQLLTGDFHPIRNPALTAVPPGPAALPGTGVFSNPKLLSLLTNGYILTNINYNFTLVRSG
jgi:hypothetical protein